MPRKYELSKRAEKQEETRRRIVDATVALHKEIGPAQTSISAIARRAGVERLTVYRHFPDEREIFHACSTRFDELHPPPDVTGWVKVSDPVERLRFAIRDVYHYYESTEPMLSKVFRDAPLVPAMSDAVAQGRRQIDAMVELAVAGWTLDDTAAMRRLTVAVRLALDFNTWHLLARAKGLSLDEAVDLMVAMISCIPSVPVEPGKSE
jgi:AcrR family transcriptional regulator